MTNDEYFTQQYRRHLSSFAGAKGGYQRRIAREMAYADMALRGETKALQKVEALEAERTRAGQKFADYADVMRVAGDALRENTAKLQAVAQENARLEAANRGLWRVVHGLLDVARIEGRSLVWADDSTHANTIEGELTHG